MMARASAWAFSVAFLDVSAVLLGLGPVPLHLPAQLLGLFPLLLHGLALDIQLTEHVLKADVFRVDAVGGLLDDTVRQPQPPGDGKGVGLARHADEHPVGGSQGLHIELTGGVLHPSGGHGVHLQLGIVGGGGHQGPHAPD